MRPGTGGAGAVTSPLHSWLWLIEAFWAALDLICVGPYDDSTYVEDDPLAGALWNN